MKPHVWHQLSRKITYKYCTRCGLIWLNNELTKNFLRKPCPGRDED